MKKVVLIAVGKLKENFFLSAAAEYTKRLSRFCDFKLVELTDFAVGDSVKKESELILSAINANSAGNSKNFWLLDVEGEQISSPEFSEKIDRNFLVGTLVFVIGGSNGVSEEIKKLAAKKISFGRFTYPHQLVRVMFLEQLYRSFTITSGLPYHK